MLVLFETPAGHALFKMHEDAAVRTASEGDLESEDAIKSLVKLKAFSRFTDTTSALAAATALVEGKPSKDLRKFLKNEVTPDDRLAVADAKLGAALKEKTGLQCIFSSEVTNIMRAIRANLDALLEGQNDAVTGSTRDAMVLGLAHSLSRYKLKFSPDKVDTMIVQAISLLDELDKEINIYAMRLREWYGWHFPEMAKIVVENATYARVVDLMKIRSAAAESDFSSLLSSDVEAELKQAAMISMGTEISDEDVTNIRSLCAQVINLTEYRATLYEYLKNRMIAIAPNLTAMVGELVGARLIAHAGSLLNLAKYPASTVQILGAEKALFRALKTKHATPKYGLIFHASVVGQASLKHKGKISRTLAAKTALSIRVDALGEAGEDASVGEQGRIAVENRLSQLEGRTDFIRTRLKIDEKLPKVSLKESAGKQFNNMGDMVMGGRLDDDDTDGDDDDDEKPGLKVKSIETVKVVKKEVREDDGDVVVVETEKKKKKKKKEKRVSSAGNGDAPIVVDDDAQVMTPKVKKRKESVGEEESTPKSTKSKVGSANKSSEKKEKKKKRKRSSEADLDGEGSSKKKKKKKAKVSE